MAKEKMIIARFDIADCEDSGDLVWAEGSVEHLLGINAKITKIYWDGRDCGSAYIEFEFPLSRLSIVDEKISDKMSYYYVNIDINDYLSIGKVCKGQLYRKYNKFTRQDFKETIDKGRGDYSEGFENKIMVMLFFKHRKTIDADTIMSKAAQTLGSNAKIIGYRCERVDGNHFTNVIFTIPYEDIDGTKFKEFGDYHLGHQGWLGKNHIYGELSIVHELKCSGMEYDKFKDVIKRIANKEDLVYKTFSHETLVVPYDEYMKEGHVPIRIKRGRDEYWVYFG